MKLKRSKPEEPLIRFLATKPGLADIEECRPKPAKEFRPEWWGTFPGFLDTDTDTVFKEKVTARLCPAFPDYFSQGYIIPMWADTTLWYDKETRSWRWRCGSEHGSPYSLEVHSGEQFLDHVPRAHFLANEMTFIFKFNCPWQFITPKGYSVFQMPLFYHFSQQFKVLPGVLHTDIHHQVNQQVVYFGDKTEVFIPRGTPIAQYIPFKRIKGISTIEYPDPEAQRMMDHSLLEITSTFNGSYSKRKKALEREIKGI
jgi:hypothetical protein